MPKAIKPNQEFTETTSDNALNDAKFTFSAAELQVLLSAAANQGNTQQSAIDNLLKNYFSAGRFDEDTGETEVVRSQNLSWPYNQKLVAALELGKLADSYVQGSQIAANLINQSNLANLNAVTQNGSARDTLVQSVAGMLGAFARDTKQLAANPFYLTETAPADDNENS